MSPFEELMEEVCVHYGYCGGIIDGTPTHVTDLIPATGLVTADQFVEWVMQADGVKITDTSYSKHFGLLRDAFIRQFGVEPVDSAKLRYSAT